jgi:hypothetical protein
VYRLPADTLDRKFSKNSFFVKKEIFLLKIN